MKSLFKTVAIITIFSFLTRVLGFVFRIVLSRVVGAEGVGLYQVAMSVFGVLMTLIASGLPIVISRLSASYAANKERKKEGSLVSVALIYGLVISILLCAIVLIFRGVFSRLFTDARCVQILIILLPSLVFSSVYCVLRGAMWGQGNYFALCITEFYEQIVRIILGILAISATLSAIENALNMAWTMSLACLLSMLLVILLFFYYGGKLGRPKRIVFSSLVKESTPITLMRVVGSFMQPLIAVIIPARLKAIGYTSAQSMSLYGVAVGMTLPLLYVPTTIIGSLSTALVPDLSKAQAQNDIKHIEERVRTSIFFALFISSMFVPVFIGIGEQIGMFLYDNIMSGTLLASAAWVLVPMSLTNITSAVLNSLGYEKRSFFNFMIGGIFMFLSLWLLPKYLGINALVWSMGINYLIVCVLNVWLLKRKLGIELKLPSKILKMLALIVPASALSAFIVNLGEYFLPLFINLVIGGVVAVGSFILLGAVFNFIDVKAFIVLAKRKFFKSKFKLKRKTKNV